jgi:hypothetical protein
MYTIKSYKPESVEKTDLKIKEASGSRLDIMAPAPWIIPASKGRSRSLYAQENQA